MLDKDEELRLASIRDILRHEQEEGGTYNLSLETVIWLAGVAKTLNDELKNQPQLVCDGIERHTHYQIEEGIYVTHRHSHELRRMHFNNLHHHPPQDHRRSRE